MRQYISILALLIITLPTKAQEVFGRFIETDHAIDAKIFYTKNETPGLAASYLNYQVTLIKNFQLLKGNLTKDPVIGFSLNPSISYAPFMKDKEQVRYTLMHDGLLNFTPSLYLAVRPEPKSKFLLFVNTAGGIRLYNRLSDLDTLTTDYKKSDSQDGVFDQWVFDIGGGLDYDRKFSLSFKFGKGWHDVTKSTEDYYRKYINPAGSTYMQYMSVRGNFALFSMIKKTTTVSGFLEWAGYSGTFDNERMLRVGISGTYWGKNKAKDKEKHQSGNDGDGSEKKKRRKGENLDNEAEKNGADKELTDLVKLAGKLQAPEHDPQIEKLIASKNSLAQKEFDDWQKTNSIPAMRTELIGKIVTQHSEQIKDIDHLIDISGMKPLSQLAFRKKITSAERNLSDAKSPEKLDNWLNSDLKSLKATEHLLLDSAIKQAKIELDKIKLWADELPQPGREGIRKDAEGALSTLASVSDAFSFGKWEKGQLITLRENLRKEVHAKYTNEFEELIHLAHGVFWPTQESFINKLADNKKLKLGDATAEALDKAMIRNDSIRKAINAELLKQNIIVLNSSTNWDSEGPFRDIQSISGIDYHDRKLYLVGDRRDQIFSTATLADDAAITLSFGAATPSSGVSNSEAIQVGKNGTWIAVEEDEGEVKSYIIHMHDSKVDTVKLPTDFKSANYRDNAGIEGIALTDKEDFLWFINERSFKNVTDGSLTLVKTTIKDMKSTTFKYQPTTVPGSEVGVSEILSYADNQLLVLERRFNQSTCKAGFTIYHVAVNTSSKKIIKKSVFDSNNLSPELVDNFEGMTFGPQVNGNKTLILVSDNNGAEKTECKKQKTVWIALEIRKI